MFYWLSRIHVERHVPYIWSFFEVGHGKGEHEGVGSCLKRALVKEKLMHILLLIGVVQQCHREGLLNQ